MRKIAKNEDFKEIKVQTFGSNFKTNYRFWPKKAAIFIRYFKSITLDYSYNTRHLKELNKNLNLLTRQ